MHTDLRAVGFSSVFICVHLWLNPCPRGPRVFDQSAIYHCRIISMTTSTKSAYTARDIEVLEGLEPVRKRPSMYIGGVDSRGLHHLLWEILDNSVDEYLAGEADKIVVTLHKDGCSATVTDNGRGIPVDIHPKIRRPALEVILTTLH